MDALTKIEMKLARLRDRLYVERMGDVERERLGIETGKSAPAHYARMHLSLTYITAVCAGTHPELLHLTRLIELRRDRKLELARKWLDGLEAVYERQRATNEYIAWSCWTVSRRPAL